jgi:hypothetical protein
MMRFGFAVLLGLFISGLALAAIPTPTQTPPPKAPVIEIKDPAQFFPWFYGMRNKRAQRGQFETEEAFQKRIPPPFDSSKILYFKVGEGPVSYYYDIATQTLTIGNGECDSDQSFTRWDPRTNFDFQYGGSECLVITLKSVYHDKGSYLGQNAFGVKARIRKSEVEGFRFKILNIEFLPGQYDHVITTPSGENMGIKPPIGDGSIVGYMAKHNMPLLKIPLQIEPSLAKKLAPNLEILIAVQLPAYEKCILFIDDPSTPTIDSLYETSGKRYQIEAKAVAFLVIDKTTKAVIKTIPVPTPAPSS